MNPSSIKIKVCGITRAENMKQLAALQPDFMGFIFHAPSPRDVSRVMDALPVNELPHSIKKVAVMVNKPLEDALQIVQQYNFEMVQLHGAESPEYCATIRETTQVIKAFGVGEKLPGNLDEYTDCADYFLFDTLSRKSGGTGKSFEHKLLAGYTQDKPYLLAGGISAEFEISKLQRQLGATLNNAAKLPFALDINSRFEISPGFKDAERVKKFIQQLRKSVLSG